MNAPITAGMLSAAWIAAKKREDAARAERIELEKTIVAMLPAKDEGTVRDEADGFAVAVTYKMARKVDAKALTAAWPSLGKIVQDAFKWAPDVSLSQLRALEHANPVAYASAVRFITTTPAKPSVKIEEIK